MKVKDVITLVQNIGMNAIDKDLAGYILKCAEFDLPNGFLTQDYYNNTYTVPIDKSVNSFIRKSFDKVNCKDFKVLAYSIIRIELIQRSHINIRQIELLIRRLRKDSIITEEEYLAIRNIFGDRMVENINLRVVKEGNPNSNFNDALLSYLKQLSWSDTEGIDIYLDDIIEELKSLVTKKLSKEYREYLNYLNREVI